MTSHACRGLAFLLVWVHTAKVHALQHSAVHDGEGGGQSRITNLAKESFSIRSDGEHKLVQLPRVLQNGEHASLRADARVSHLDSTACNNTFIRAMTLYGDWTGEYGLLHISSGPDKRHQPIHVNTQSPKEFFKRFSDSDVEFGANNLSIKFGDIGFHFTKEYEGPYGIQKGYLNLRITGLKQFRDVGGLLGYDGHAEAEKPDIMCAAATPPASGTSFVGLGRGAAKAGGSKIEVVD